MRLKEWLKSAAVAGGGGMAAALSAVMMDPTKFNLSNGLKDEALIALQGALVGLAALFIRSPLGSSLVKALTEAKLRDEAQLRQLRLELNEAKAQGKGDSNEKQT
jgi:hypothetical protein